MDAAAGDIRHIKDLIKRNAQHGESRTRNARELPAVGELLDEIVQLLAVVAHTGHKGVDVSALLLAGDLREKSILRRKGAEIVLVKKASGPTSLPALTAKLS